MKFFSSQNFLALVHLEWRMGTFPYLCTEMEPNKSKKITERIFDMHEWCTKCIHKLNKLSKGVASKAIRKGTALQHPSPFQFDVFYV